MIGNSHILAGRVHAGMPKKYGDTGKIPHFLIQTRAAGFPCGMKATPEICMSSRSTGFSHTVSRLTVRPVEQPAVALGHDTPYCFSHTLSQWNTPDFSTFAVNGEDISRNIACFDLQSLTDAESCVA